MNSRSATSFQCDINGFTTNHLLKQAASGNKATPSFPGRTPPFPTNSCLHFYFKLFKMKVILLQLLALLSVSSAFSPSTSTLRTNLAKPQFTSKLYSSTIETNGGVTEEDLALQSKNEEMEVSFHIYYLSIYIT